MSTPPGEYYTQERWTNWLDRIEEEELDPENEDSARLLLNLQDDAAIAIAKIVSAYEDDRLDDDEAIDETREHADALGLDEAALSEVGADLPLAFASTGFPFLVVPVSYFEQLSAVDPDLTATMPAGVAAATGLDALTHAIESYVSLLRTPYTDTLARRAVELVAENLRPAVAQGAENDAARANMSFAATLAGQAFVNSGLGAVHALTYPLGMECGLGHGLANGVLLPHVMRYNVPAEVDRFADLAELLGAERRPGESARAFADRSVEAVFDLLEDVGVPTSIAAYGDFDRETFESFADVAFEHSEHNIDRNPRAMDHEDVVEVFEAARVGRYSSG